MKPNRLRLLGQTLLAILIGAGAGAFFARRGASPKEPPPAATAKPASVADTTTHARSDATQVPAADATAPSPADPSASPPAAALLSGEAAIQTIDELTVTYDAASVPALARYLRHADADIRAAARDGLINLGERAAIPFLEDAAKTASADEAKALREAAEFLALPTWTEHRAARKKAKAAGAP